MAGGVRTASLLVGILINLLPSRLIIVFLSLFGRVLVIFFQLFKTSVEKNELFHHYRVLKACKVSKAKLVSKGTR